MKNKNVTKWFISHSYHTFFWSLQHSNFKNTWYIVNYQSWFGMKTNLLIYPGSIPASRSVQSLLDVGVLSVFFFSRQNCRVTLLPLVATTLQGDRHLFLPLAGALEKKPGNDLWIHIKPYSLSKILFLTQLILWYILHWFS